MERDDEGEVDREIYMERTMGSDREMGIYRGKLNTRIQ